MADQGSPMRGRGAEFETVLGLLDGTQQGRGRVLLVEGEPGTGKSLLLARAGEEAGRRGFRVVAVSAGAPGRGAHPPTAAPARGAAPALGE